MAAEVLVGTYAKAGGAGLCRVRVAPDRLELLDCHAQAPNASWAVHGHALIYCVDEAEEGRIGIHRRTPQGWQRVAAIPSHGAEPCYLALDRQLLAVANYGSGTIALYTLGEDGLPIGDAQRDGNSGSGPFEDRQDGPHAHCVLFGPDRASLYHVDLGTDQILRHAIAADDSLGAVAVAFQAPPGSGPRHLLFHPRQPIALLVSELASTLSLLDLHGDTLSVRQRLSTLPRDYEGESLGGHLALNAAGDRIYVSNRGHDSIAVFALRPDGSCGLLQHVPSGGASPRQFALLESEGLLLLANEEAGNLVLFRVDEEGLLEPTGVTRDLPGAVFVLPA